MQQLQDVKAGRRAGEIVVGWGVRVVKAVLRRETRKLDCKGKVVVLVSVLTKSKICN